MKKGIGRCAVVAIGYDYATAEIIAKAFAVLPKDTGLIEVRKNPVHKRFEFLVASDEFPEDQVSKKHLDFPMIRFKINNGKFEGWEIAQPGPPPSRANLQ